jgi:hypothetical protein
MYRKCSAYGLLFVVAIWALPSIGGEYVTYTNPKTGVRYYGDALPPSVPSNVKNDRDRGLAEMEHMSNKPSEPGRGPVFRDFNRATNAWGQYEADMFEWRARGREFRQQYNAPMGFGRNPTGFSREEKRYYKSYGR